TDPADRRVPGGRRRPGRRGILAASRVAASAGPPGAGRHGRRHTGRRLFRHRGGGRVVGCFALRPDRARHRPGQRQADAGDRAARRPARSRPACAGRGRRSRTGSAAGRSSVSHGHRRRAPASGGGARHVGGAGHGRDYRGRPAGSPGMTSAGGAMQPTVPAARGEVSAALIEALTSDGHLPVVLADMDPYGEDLHLALHVCYELHYRGFAGVSDDWEWDPGLLSVRRDLERQFLEALRRDVGGGTDVAGEFDELLVLPADGEGLSGYLAQEAERWQLEEYFALRSIYHLKEADPHVWVIPRLQGQPKAALVAVEYDEFGGGRAENLHAKLYADLLDGAGLSSEYLHYQDQAPAAMLAVV